MSLPSINTATQAAPTASVLASNNRAADGDYKVRSAATSQTKDADGDYKAVPKPAAATSSSGVQAALSALTKGG